MNDFERADRAIELMRSARRFIDLAEVNPDPVAKRRHHVTAAASLRKAVNLLDDDGRLQEETP